MTKKETARLILDRVQSDFPLCETPYDQLAEELSIPREQLLERLQEMIDGEEIRRIGPIFNPRKLGYQSTLCAAAVEPGQCDAVAGFINSFVEVTHNYLRDHRFNVWFTLIACSKDKFGEIVREIENQQGVRQVLILPATKVYKIKVHFNTSGSERSEKDEVQNTNQLQINLSDRDIDLIRALQSPLKLIATPFQAIAEECDMASETVLNRIRQWCDDGTIRRFGARVNHRRIGYLANGMSVWQIDEDHLDEMGAKLSAYPQISHCYARAAVDSWPYNLYGMVHANEKQEVLDLVEGIAGKSGNPEHLVLFSTKEYKKTAPRYFLF